MRQLYTYMAISYDPLHAVGQITLQVAKVINYSQYCRKGLPLPLIAHTHMHMHMHTHTHTHTLLGHAYTLSIFYQGRIWYSHFNFAPPPPYTHMYTHIHTHSPCPNACPNQLVNYSMPNLREVGDYHFLCPLHYMSMVLHQRSMCFDYLPYHMLLLQK